MDANHNERKVQEQEEGGEDDEYDRARSLIRSPSGSFLASWWGGGVSAGERC
jgi:hypothetical protein